MSFRRIPFPNVAERTAAYRLRLSAEMQGTTVPLVLDLVALRQARAQVSTFFTGLSAIPRSEQVLLARVVAERMARAMRGT